MGRRGSLCPGSQRQVSVSVVRLVWQLRFWGDSGGSEINVKNNNNLIHLNKSIIILSVEEGYWMPPNR